MFVQGAEEGRRSSSFELELVSAAAHSQARQELQRRVKEGNGARGREMGVCCERECAAVGEQMDPRVHAGGQGSRAFARCHGRSRRSRIDELRWCSLGTREKGAWIITVGL